MTEFLFILLGLVILLLSGDALVRGAVNVSLRLGVPALVVSLTIVSVGTSAPELLISVQAVLDRAPGIAIGNVVGSNTANVLLVLGLPALLAGLKTADCDTRTTYVQMMLGTALFCAVAAMGTITWIQGGLMLAVFFAFMGHAIYQARIHQKASRRVLLPEDEIEAADPKMRWRWIVLLILLGLIGLPLGADILVNNATKVAQNYHVSETVIGLTLVAVGTSLPELATTVSAAYRNQADVALGNVIGSNMANLLGITGAAALFGDIPVESKVLGFDLWVMAAASLLIAPFVFRKVNMSPIWGGVFVILYVGYIVRVLL